MINIFLDTDPGGRYLHSSLPQLVQRDNPGIWGDNLIGLRDLTKEVKCRPLHFVGYLLPRPELSLYPELTPNHLYPFNRRPPVPQGKL